MSNLNMENVTGLVQRTELVDTITLIPNSQFDKLSLESTIAVKNTANNITYKVTPSPGTGSNISNFTIKIDKHNFLHRGVVLEESIPIKITLAADAAAAITSDNYLTALNNLSNIALRQYGLLNAIQNINLQFDSDPITNINHVSECFESISEYIEENEINEFFQASQPDRFSSYNYYSNDLPNRVLKTKDLSSQDISMLLPNLTAENIFSGGFSNNYNSRRVFLRFKSSPDLKTINCVVRLFTYIPFSMFDLSNSEQSIYGVDSMNLTITKYSDFVQRLFVLSQKYKPAAGQVPASWDDFITNIEFDQSNPNDHKSELHTKIYSPPNYINEAIMNPVNGGILPYRSNLSDIYFYPKSKSYNAGSFEGDYNLSVVPKSVYISLVKKRDGTDRMKICNLKARIKSLNITYNNAQTTIPTSVLDVFLIAKSNGLAKDFESSMYTNGYVLKLDFSKDISCGGLLVGMTKHTSFTMNGTYDSLEQDTTEYELKMVFAYEGLLTYNGSNFTVTKSLVLLDNNLDINMQAKSLYASNRGFSNMIGGGFGSAIWGGIKNLFRKGIEYVKNNPEKVVSGIGSLAKTFMGSGNQTFSNISGGSMKFSQGGSVSSSVKFV